MYKRQHYDHVGWLDDVRPFCRFGSVPIYAENYVAQGLRLRMPCLLYTSTSEEPLEAYDVVGPICESSDVFGKAIDLNKVKRGDLIALRSAGAYGEIMASGYNCRELPKGYTSDELV